MKAIKYILSKKAGITVLVLLLLSAGYIIFSVSKPNTFHEGDTITAEEMNENFDALYAKVTELEAIIDNPILGNVPAGTILPFGGDVDKIPEGWLLCDGSPYSGYEFPDLFDVIGMNFGSVGGTVFNVPDLRGMFLRGVDSGEGHDPNRTDRTALKPGGNTGDNIGSMQTDALQGHRHYIVTPSGTPRTQLNSHVSNASGYYFQDNNITQGNTDDCKGTFYIGDPLTSEYGNIRISTETRPKNVYVHYIIKY